MKGVRKWVLGCLIGAAVIALAGPMSLAVGFFSQGLSLDVKLPAKGTLEARGVAVQVPVLVVCTSRVAMVSVDVLERVSGGRVAQGGGRRQITCEGDFQKVKLTVTSHNGIAFRRGLALGKARISGCLHICGVQARHKEIHITRI